MTLKLEDRWVWDFWFARAGADYHVFYLQASRSLPDPELRHWNVSIGHAVSRDLREWQILPDALAPSPTPAWDDFTTWTGSIIEHEGVWHLFYTGASHAERGLVQRIGLATSTDLIHWEKYPGNPVLEADPRWYELLDLTAWHDQAWRDPWVYRHPNTGEFCALITARVHSGPADGRAVIAQARSADLRNWTVLAPLTEPGDFGQMEVPELVELGGRYWLLFSGSTRLSSSVRQARANQIGPEAGTHYLVGDTPDGPFSYQTDKFMVGSPHGSLYSGKLVQGPDGLWRFMAFRGRDASGHFLGELSDPYPVSYVDGMLRVDGLEP